MALSEFAFCPRAGLCLYEQDFEDDEPEAEADLYFLPIHEPRELELLLESLMRQFLWILFGGLGGFRCFWSWQPGTRAGFAFGSQPGRHCCSLPGDCTTVATGCTCATPARNVARGDTWNAGRGLAENPRCGLARA